MTLKPRMIMFLLTDLVLVNAALRMTMLLSVNHLVYRRDMLPELHLLASITAVGLFLVHSLYHRLWRFAGLRDYLALGQSVFLYVLVFYFLCDVLWSVSIQPVVMVVLFCVTTFGVAGWRFLMRATGELYHRGKAEPKSKSTLIVGAGGAGALVAKTLLDNHSLLKPKGIIDDDKAKLGMRLMGLPILGTRQNITEIVRQLNIEEIIIAIPSASGSDISEIVKLSSNTDARLKILPSVYQIIGGKIPEGQIRDIQVEDLLNRKLVQLNIKKVGGYIRDRVVMVTGAGGSVGSELCLQLAQFEPGMLVLLGRGENSIYEISSHLATKHPDLKVNAEIADVRDKARVDSIMEEYRPVVIFHAAAHKHVPLMEKCPAEAFKNNVLGTYNLARAAVEQGTETFILISTDKAVNPSSVMGATKRVAELLVQELNGWSKTCFAAVRFGNVLGSRGSVIPVFKRQISAGGPVTVTHPDMVRYFMTISEAAQLVIEAGAMARGGEVFVLDMGEPVKIVDLAMNMIKLSGYRPEKDVAINFTGIRPGEKLYEELFGSEEKPVRTAHEKIFTALTPGKTRNITKVISLFDGAGLSDEEAVLIIRRFVNFYMPGGNPVSNGGN